jgi:hypothetical protein
MELVPSRSSRRAPSTVCVSWQLRHAARQTGRPAGRLVGDALMGVRGIDPAFLIVASETDYIDLLLEGSGDRIAGLQPVEAQKLDILAEIVAHMRVVARRALQLIVGQRHHGTPAGRPVVDMRAAARRPQIAVGKGERVVIDERHRVIVGEIGSEPARKSR